ncbi:alpha/beta hydrolase [Streptomyces sp. CA-249302]|uniref:alpha/beta hydrolase n=1 Tax=Streptomyces sp. CA-249302 TaxID=3240058 RepID=UPI003D932A66
MRYPYDAELAAALALSASYSIQQLEEARLEHERYLAASQPHVDGADQLRITDSEVPAGSHGPAVGVRVFTPFLLEPPVPAALFIHGGGFVLGSIQSEQGFAAAAAVEAEAVVVSVEYRLAPENRYPAGVEDCYAAFRWMVENAAELGIDPDRIGITGSSAGGGLAAAVALMARDRGGPQPCFQLLNMPVLDDRLDTPSMVAFTDTPIWNRDSAEASWRYYLDARTAGTPDVPYYAAPARADDLSRLPAAYIATAEFDPLRDEGLLYALRLLQAGVSVEVHNFPGTFHGSDVIQCAELSRLQLAENHAALRRGLRSPRLTMITD